MKYPKDMDTELIPLCNELNLLPDVLTRYSCSGHGKGFMYILLLTCNMKMLKAINFIFNKLERDYNDIGVTVTLISDYKGYGKFHLWDSKVEDLVRIDESYVTVTFDIYDTEYYEKYRFKKLHTDQMKVVVKDLTKWFRNYRLRILRERKEFDETLLSARSCE